MERQSDLQGYKVQRGFYQVERQILNLRKSGDSRLRRTPPEALRAEVPGSSPK
jgi:hypothetical protein